MLISLCYYNPVLAINYYVTCGKCHHLCTALQFFVTQYHAWVHYVPRNSLLPYICIFHQYIKRNESFNLICTVSSEVAEHDTIATWSVLYRQSMVEKSITHPLIQRFYLLCVGPMGVGSLWSTRVSGYWVTNL